MPIRLFDPMYYNASSKCMNIPDKGGHKYDSFLNIFCWKSKILISIYFNGIGLIRLLQTIFHFILHFHQEANPYKLSGRLKWTSDTETAWTF